MIDYEAYELEMDLRLRRRAKTLPRRRRAPKEAIVELAQPGDSPVGFNPTFKAAHQDHHEYQWIVHALGGFYADSLINDVLRAVKGGKEASVYCCEAHPAMGVKLLAAKIYRPRIFRNLKNDALYREGRELLDEEGKGIRDTRRQRALKKKTRYGSELAITSWIEHEYQTLCLLYAAGADIPRPYAQQSNAILMEYVGEAQSPAPTLNLVSLERDEAWTLLERVMRNVELMLAQNRIHADLSAYNILYWKGEIKLIDFPQAVDPRVNPSAARLLARDVERVCQYFSRFGARADATHLAADLWSRYMRAEL